MSVNPPASPTSNPLSPTDANRSLALAASNPSKLSRGGKTGFGGASSTSTPDSESHFDVVSLKPFLSGASSRVNDRILSISLACGGSPRLIVKLEPAEGEQPPPPRPAADVSATRLYLGNLPRDVTKEEISEHFKSHGTIAEVKLMNGFGFIEYEDAMDARDVVPAFHGQDFKGQRLTVQFARGTRPRSEFHNQDRPGPRPRRTAFRMQLTSLPDGTSWQDLKDFARRSGLDVVYSEVSRERDGRGFVSLESASVSSANGSSFVEYESSQDLRTAVEKLDKTEFKGTTVNCVADEQAEAPSYGGGYRGRSRSPRRGYGPPRDDYYHDRRGPPRGYSPYRDDYRRRSPPREDYYNRGRYRSPPRGMRGPPPEEQYPPPRGGYRDDGYGPPPPRGGYREDPYANGYDRPPPRRTPPPRGGGGGGGGYGGYEDRGPRGGY